MAGTVKRLEQELQLFDLEYSEEGVPGRMLELCIAHRLKEDEIANEWVAFSTTKLLPLTVDNLNLLEHEVLNRKAAKARQKVVKREQHSGSKDIHSIQELIEVEVAEEDLLDSYGTPSKGSQKRNLSTPENPQSKRVSSIARSPHLLFSPSSFSPSATPSQKYGMRGNRGQVVTTFGAVHGTSWNGTGGRSARVKTFSPSEESLTKSYKFMFQKLLDIREEIPVGLESDGTDTELEYTDAEVDCTDTELDCTDVELEGTNAELDCTRSELDYPDKDPGCTDVELNCSDTELDGSDTELDCSDTELDCSDTELDCTDVELDHTDTELD